MIRIGIVDDNLILRQCLASFLNNIEGIETVLTAKNGKDLLEQLKQIQPEVLLLDLQMPIMDGFQACKQVRSQYPEIKIIIFSQLSFRESLYRIIEADAHGFLGKNESLEELTSAIFNVVHNEFFLAKENGAVFRDFILWNRRKEKGAVPPYSDLSERELSVLRLACKDMLNAHIGKELGISERTVEGHKSRMLLKTGSKTFNGVIAFALKNLYITPYGI